LGGFPLSAALTAAFCSSVSSSLRFPRHAKTNGGEAKNKETFWKFFRDCSHPEE
jgi:hypothetical protein